MIIMRLFADNYAPNEYAQLIVRRNNFEHLYNAVGESAILEILEQNKVTPRIRLIYNLDGELDRIMLNEYLPRPMSLTSSEWESLFDYFSRLPPSDLPNQQSFIWDDYHRNLLTSDSMKQNYFKEIIESGYYSDFIGIVYKKDVDALINSNNFNMEALRTILYKNIPIDKCDSLFSDYQWVELKKSHSNNLSYKHLSEFDNVKHEININYNAKDYTWEKISIENININIQLPKVSKVTKSKDSVSISIQLPNDYFMTIQDTKNISESELYKEDKKNLRKRLVQHLTVDKNKIVSWGDFILNGKEFYWLRYRYHYGVTVTLYGNSDTDFKEYQNIILNTITMTLRPKYNNIYLN